MNARETRTDPPIACTLGAGAYRKRLTWIAELNRSSLQNARREGTRLILSYDLQAGGSVREMIRREQECCAFLHFELREDEKELMLAITAPEATKDALDALFEPFLREASAAGARRCEGHAPDAAPSRRGNGGTAVAASAAGVAAAGALACAACCILPFALPAATLAVAGGALAWLASFYKGALVAAVALVAVAWVWVGWQSLRTRKQPSATTVLVMLAASAMLALAYSWPAIEPGVVAALTTG